MPFKLIEQGSRLFEVRRVKPLCEPAIDLREERPGLFGSTLFLEQAAQGHGCAQFPGSGLLTPSHLDGLAKTGLGLGYPATGLQLLALDPMHLRFPNTLTSLFHKG